MVRSFLFLILFLSQTAFAAKEKQETPISLKSKALQEYQQLKGKPLPISTDASVTGLLTLEDPRKKEITRPWNYYLGLKLQSFQASGSATNDLGEDFELSRRSESFMPGLEFGVLFKGWTYQGFKFSPLVKTTASYTNQKESVTLESGFLIEEAYLNTAIATAGIGINLSNEQLPGLQLEAAYKLGAINYTQASTNNFANFSESAEISIFQASLLYSLNEKWSVGLERQQREIVSQSNQVEITPVTYEFGTRIQW